MIGDTQSQDQHKGCVLQKTWCQQIHPWKYLLQTQQTPITVVVFTVVMILKI